MESQLNLYNSLSKKVEAFVPQNETVSIYICGITPYDTTHLGHIFTYVAADILIRYLKYRGLKIKCVQNVTDIDEPIFRESRKRDEDWRELGKRWTVNYIEDMKSLNITPPEHYPAATEMVREIIAAIEKLLHAGVAYESGGNVYFNIDAWAEYGKLSNVPRQEMLPIANDRGNDPDDANKRDPLDFVLWRARKPEEPAWNSPWGKGRPGWHIECSTMANLFLGETIDIHGGGDDLIFPHHESEIAQSECATGKSPFARYWFHTAMVQKEGKKMSKSVGNLIMVRDLLETSSPDGLRTYLARHHYRQAWELDRKKLQEAEELAQKLKSVAVRTDADPETEGGARNAQKEEEWRTVFLKAMDDDLQTPRVVQLMSELADAILAGRNVKGARAVLREVAAILGLCLDAETAEQNVIQGWEKHLARFR